MSESHLESDNRRMPQQEQLRERRNGKEPRDWIREDEFTSYIKENSNVDRQRPLSSVSIFTVPNFLKKQKRDAYVPEIVSLGPYHHRSAELPPMNNHKGKALRRMMARFNEQSQRNLANDPNNMDFNDCARAEIVKLENEMRDSYEENIDCDGKTLSLMLCLDGCFILEILRTIGGDELPLRRASKYYEPIFEENKIDYTGFDILSDILKLENQIPLIVLQKLLQLELDSTADVVDRKLLEVLVKGTFKMYPFAYGYMKDCSWTETYKEQHLLGLLHTLIVSPPPKPNSQNNVPLPVESRIAVCLPCQTMPSIPRAVELRNAGIKFKASDGGIRGIQFDENKATICLPPINIDDYTEILFRNLIALEMCKAKPWEISYVTCYTDLMDQLIDSEQDVALLRKEGIVTNGIGSDEEVAKIFNGLCKGVTVDGDVFDKLIQKVNAHYGNKIKVHIAHFEEDHLSSPWKIFALLGATGLLLLTVVQTIFLVISVYK